MRPPYQVATLLFAISAQTLSYSRAQVDSKFVKTVTSSSFELSLYPTPTKLDGGATEKIQNTILNVLLISSSRSASFDALSSMDILVEGVELKENFVMEENPESLIEFKVIAEFDLQDDTSSLPSKFALDNLIARTFSQPSTKSSFIGLIVLTGDPFLINVEGIGINVVDEGSNEQALDNTVSGLLSKIDLVLVIGSSFIVIGIVLVLITHCQKNGYEDVQEQKSFKTKNKATGKVPLGDRFVDTENQHMGDEWKEQISIGRMMSIQGNIVAAGSLESSIDGQSEIVLSIANGSSAVSFASSSSSTSRPSASSFISKGEEKADTSVDTSEGENGDSTIDSQSTEKKTYSYQPTVHKASTGLASKLSKLPTVDSYFPRKRVGVFHSSSASAPTVLEESMRQLRFEGSVDEKSIKSARSAASIESSELHSKRNKVHQDSPFVLNGLVLIEGGKEFHESWLELKRKALEDIEEDSIEDVFRVDIQRNGVLLKKEVELPNNKWSASVTDWMKSIRVIHSVSETQSSVEHSSIEPGSSHAFRNNSLDLSLEDSLATSVVEP